jgi:hypothetical protein
MALAGTTYLTPPNNTCRTLDTTTILPSPTTSHLQCARRIDERPPDSSLPGPLLQQHRQPPLVDIQKHKSPATALASYIFRCPSVHPPRPDSHLDRNLRTALERHQQSVPSGLFANPPRLNPVRIHCQPSGRQSTILGLLHPFIRWHFSNEPAP